MAAPHRYLPALDSAASPVVRSAGTLQVALPDSRFISEAIFSRRGGDLVLSLPSGETVAIRDYFLQEPPPDLIAGNAHLSPALVRSFLISEAPSQYAQLGGVPEQVQIGTVQEIKGQVFAVRADGTRVQLATGDPVFQGDVIETGPGAAVSLLFVDQTSFALGADGRLALDELVFDPVSQAGSSQFSILKGVFVFASGQIAKSDNTKMIVNTPVATIGIRGTEVAGKVGSLDEPSQFTVLDGTIEVTTGGGTITLSGRNESTQVVSFTAPPGASFVLSDEGITVIYQGVSDVTPSSRFLGFSQVTGAASGAVESEDSNESQGESAEQGEDAQESEADDGDPQSEQQAGEQFGGEQDLADGTEEEQGVESEEQVADNDAEEQQTAGLESEGEDGEPPQSTQTANADPSPQSDTIKVVEGGNGSDPVAAQPAPASETQAQPQSATAKPEPVPNASPDPSPVPVTQPAPAPEPSPAPFHTQVYMTASSFSVPAYDPTPYSVTGTSGGDIISTGSGDDYIQGGSGDDDITAGAGNDSVYGEAGHDTIVAGTGEGNDFYDGGADFDLIKYFSATEDLVFVINDGTLDGTYSYTYGGAQIGNDSFTNIEQIYSGAGNDTFEYNATDEIYVHGWTGTDTLDYSSLFLEEGDSLTVDMVNGTTTASGTTSFTHGFGGIENIRGAFRNDIIIGNTLSNVFYGSDGTDTIHGGGGTDTLSFSTDSWGLTLEQTGSGSYAVTAFDTTSFSDIDVFIAGSGDDDVTLNGTDLTVHGGAGQDTLTLDSFTATGVSLTTGTGAFFSDFERFRLTDSSVDSLVVGNGATLLLDASTVGTTFANHGETDLSGTLALNRVTNASDGTMGLDGDAVLDLDATGPAGTFANNGLLAVTGGEGMWDLTVRDGTFTNDGTVSIGSLNALTLSSIHFIDGGEFVGGGALRFESSSIQSTGDSDISAVSVTLGANNSLGGVGTLTLLSDMSIAGTGNTLALAFVNQGSLHVESGGGVTLSDSVFDATAGFLTLDGSVTVTDGTLLLGSGSSLSGGGQVSFGTAGVVEIAANESFTYGVSAPAVALAGAEIAGDGTFVNAGTLAVGSVDVTGTFLNEGFATVGATETLAVHGVVVNGASGTLDLFGGSTAYLVGPGTFVNRSTAPFTIAQDVLSVSVVNEGSMAMTGGTQFLTGNLTNEEDGHLVIGNAGGGGVGVGFNGILTNAGTLLMTGSGSGVAHLSLTGTDAGETTLVNQSGGLFRVDAESTGQHTLTGAFDNAGTIDVDGYLRVAPGSGTMVNSGLIAVDADGEMVISGGHLRNSGTLSSDGDLRMNAGTLTMLAGGTLAGSGYITLQGLLAIDTGVTYTHGTASPILSSSEGMLEIGGDGTFVNARGLSPYSLSIGVASFVNASGGTLGAEDGLTVGAIDFANQDGGTILLEAQFGDVAASFAQSFTNDGTILLDNADGQDGHTVSLELAETLTNTGLIATRDSGEGGGTRVLEGAIVNAADGTIDVQAETIFDGTATVQNAGLVALSGDATLTVASGDLRNAGTVDLDGTGDTLAIASGATFTALSGGTLTGGGQFDIAGTLAAGSGVTFTQGTASPDIALTDGAVVTGAGTVALGGGVEIGGTLTVDAALNLASTAEVTVTAPLTLDGTNTLTNAATLDLGGATVLGTVRNDGLVTLASSDTLTVDGVLTNGADGTLDLGAGTGVLQGDGTFVNQSTAPFVVDANLLSITVVNEGSIAVIGDSQQLTGDLTNAAGGHLALGSEDENVLFVQYGQLSNAGTLLFTGSAGNVATLSLDGENPGENTLVNQSGALIHIDDTASGQHKLTGAFDNAGTIQVDGFFYAVPGLGETLVNSGLIAIDADGELMMNSAPFRNSGTLQVDGNLELIGGTLTLLAGAVIVGTGTVDSDGTILVDTGVTFTHSSGGPGFGSREGTMTLAGGGSFVNEGLFAPENLSITVSGFTNTDGGTLRTAGTLTIDTADFANEEGATLSILAEDGNAAAIVQQDIVNDGTILLDNADSQNSHAASLELAETLTNTGLIETRDSGGAGGVRMLNGAIANAAGGTIDIQAETAFDGTATVQNDGLIAVSGVSTLTVETGELRNAGTIDLDSADDTLVVASGATFVALSGGTVTGDGLIDVYGTLATATDTVTIDGALHLQSGAVVGFSGDTLTLSGGGTLTNETSLAFDDTTKLESSVAGFVNNGTLTYQDGGHILTASGFSNASDGQLTVGGTTAGTDGTLTATGGFSNAGAILVAAGTGADDSTLTVAGMLSNSGNVGLGVSGGTEVGTLSAGFANQAGGTILAIGTGAIDVGTLDASNAGLLRSSGSLSLALNTATLTNSGTILVDAGDAFAVQGGEIRNSGTMTADGTLTLENGTVTMLAGGVLSGSGMLDIDGALAIDTGVTFTYGTVAPALGSNAGTLEIAGGGTFVNARDLAPDDLEITVASFVNASGGTLHVGDGFTVGTAGFSNESGGTLAIEAEIGNVLATVQGAFTNDGVILLDSLDDQASRNATLTAAGTLTNAGIIRAQDSGGAGGQRVLTGTIVNDAAGTIDVQSATRIAGTAVVLNEGLITVADDFGLTVQSSELRNAGTLDVNESILISADSTLTGLSGGVLTGSGFIVVSGTLAAASGVTVTQGTASPNIALQDGSKIVGPGTVSLGGLATFDGTVTVDGSLALASTANFSMSGTTLTVAGSGILDNAAALEFYSGNELVATVANFTNRGSLSYLDSGHSLESTAFSNVAGGVLTVGGTASNLDGTLSIGDFSNAGNIRVQAGAGAGDSLLDVTGTLTNTGNVTLGVSGGAEGGTFAGGFVNQAGGTIVAAGQGTIDVGAYDVSNAGLLRSSGTMTLALGSQTLTNSGTLMAGGVSALFAVEGGEIRNSGTIEATDSGDVFSHDGLLSMLAGGTLTGDGTISLGGTLDIGSGVSYAYSSSGPRLLADGGFDLTGDGTFSNQNLLNLGSGIVDVTHFVNAAAGSLTTTNTLTVTSDTFSNAGLLKIAADTVDALGTFSAGFANSGTVRLDDTSAAGVDSASLSVAAGTVLNSGLLEILNTGGAIGVEHALIGTFANAAGGTVQISAGLVLEDGLLDLSAGTLALSGAQTLRVADGTLALADGLAVSGSGLVSIETDGALGVLTGKTYTNAASSSLTLNFDNSEIVGAGLFVNEGTMLLGGNAISVTTFSNDGLLQVGDGTLTVSGSTAFTNASGGTLEIAALTAGPSRATFASGLTNAGLLTLDNQGTVAANATLTVTSGSLNNTGTIEVLDNSELGGNRIIDADIANAGLIYLDHSATVTLSTIDSRDGSIDIEAGQTLTFDNSTLQVGSDTTLTGGGLISLFANTTVEVVAGETFTRTSLSPLSNLGGTWISGAGTFVNQSGALNIGNADFGVSYANNHGTLTTSGGYSTIVSVGFVNESIGLMRFQNDSGLVIDTDGFDNQGTLQLSASGTFVASLTVASGHTLSNNGLLEVAAGGNGGTFSGTLYNGTAGVLDIADTLTLSGDVINAGTFQPGTADAFTTGSFTNASTGTLLLDSSSAEVRLTHDGTFVNQGTILFAGTASNDAILDLTGTLANDSTLVNSGQIAVDGSGLGSGQLYGGLDNSGTVEVDGYLYLYMQGDTLTNQAGGLFHVDNTGYVDIQNGAIVNAGTLDIDGSLTFESGTLSVLAGSALTGGGTLYMGGTFLVGSGVTYTHTTLAPQLSGADGVGFDISGNGTFANQGTLVVDDGGTINIDRFANQSGATLGVDGSMSVSSASFTNAGLLSILATDFTPAQMAFAAGFSNDGTIILDSDDGQGTQEATLAISSGTLVNNGTILAAAGTGGVRVFAGTVVNSVSGVIELDQSTRIDGGVMNGTVGALSMTAPTITVTGGGRLLNGSGFTIGATQTLQVGDGDGSGSYLAGSALLSNQGDLIFGEGSGQVTVGSFSNVGDVLWAFGSDGNYLGVLGTFSNSGEITLEGSGTFNLSTGTHTNQSVGMISVWNELVIDNTGIFRNEGQFDMSDGSTLTIEGGTFVAVATGAMALDGANHIAGSGTFLNQDLLDFDDGSTISVARFTNSGSGAVTVNGGTLTFDSASVFINSSNLTIASGAALLAQNDADVELSSSYTISANRSILLDSGTLTVNGGLSALTNSGTFNWLTGSTDNLYEGGLTNNGVMTLNGSGTLDLDGLINSNSGTIAINSHVTMELGALGTFTNTEFISIAAGQTLDVNGALFLNGLGATISAVGGVFDAVGALFTNLGTLLGGNSPGYAYIMGNMALGDTSQLIAELGDTAPGLGGYDVYDVSGSLDLGGTLSVVEYGSFSVGAGDRFTVVTAGTLGHSFDSIDGLEIGHGVVLDVEQTGFDLTLVGHAVTHQGSASADTLTGGSSADAMVGGDGADLLIGGGGADILFGGLGDDIFRIADAAFSRIDGGAGVDTLQLAFGTFDMRAYRFDQVNDMEAIDLTGTGTLVTVNADIVRAMTSGTNALTNSSHALVITGDSGDVADIGSGWTNTGTTTIAGEGYAIYDHANGAQLAIHQNLGVAAA